MVGFLGARMPGREITRHRGDAAPYRTNAPLGRARRSWRAESNAGGHPPLVPILQSACWITTCHVPGCEILRHRGDAAPYRTNAPVGRARRSASASRRRRDARPACRTKCGGAPRPIANDIRRLEAPPGQSVRSIRHLKRAHFHLRIGLD
jgi:hypothetical protein